MDLDDRPREKELYVVFPVKDMILTKLYIL